MVRPFGRAAERLAVAAFVAGALVWWAASRAGGSPLGLAVLGVILALPPLAVAAFAVAVRALVALPRKLREGRSALRGRAELIRDRAGEVVASRRRGPLQALRATVRLWWAVASSREVLEVLGPTTLLLSPATVVLAAIGAVAAAFEILGGAVALIWLAVA